MTIVRKATAPKDPPLSPLERQLAGAILRAVDKVQDQTVVADVELAIASGDIQGALDAIRLEIGEAELETAVPVALRTAYETAALSSQKELQAEIGAGLRVRFDLVNPEAVNYVRESAATLIEDFGDTSLEAIRDLIRRAMSGELTPAKLAQQIVDSGIGLNKQQLNAIENLRRGLEADGKLSAQQIERLVSAQYQRALKYRARMIAQYEISRAARAGNQELWRQAIERGLIDPGVAVQQWMTSDPCDDCAVLDGLTAPLGEDFPHGGGDGPPLHPNCKCGLRMLPYGLAGEKRAAQAGAQPRTFQDGKR